MNAAPKDLLQEYFGYRHFRPGQEAVIGHLLDGHSSAAVFPTGGGKSLCYQLPSLALSGLTLVVSPLIALMKDQIDQLQQRQIAAERLDSTLDADQTAAVMQGVRAGQLRMLYVAPERFNNERFRNAITQVPISLFAVDEAHCISEWGHNFRPDYLKLARFAKTCAAERILALTATATPQVLDDICRGFEIRPECAVRTGFYRSNLTTLFTPLPAEQRDEMLRERLQSRPVGPTIVYVTLQRTAEQVAERLQAAGFDARAYHAGLKDETRAEVQDWFLGSSTAVVVATIAFGMGIDKPNIRYVYHYNLPKSLENYSQEIGRAGRDDLPSVCEAFVCLEDLSTLENFVYGDTPSKAAVRGLLQAISTEPDEFDVSIYDLASRFDIRQLVVRTLLTYLELDGYLREGTPFYAQYQFKPLASSSDILAGFEGERREFLASVFRQAKKSRTWFRLDLDSVVQATGAPRARVIRALDHLSEQGLLELKVQGIRNRFQRLQPMQELDALTDDLHDRTLTREARELQRLSQVLELAAWDGCQVNRLCEHFGESRDAACGHCSWCRNEQRPAVCPPRTETDIDPDVWDRASGVRREHPEALADPRAFARFLCGLTSPRLSRCRLSSHALFGACGNVPFSAVLAAAEADASDYGACE